MAFRSLLIGQHGKTVIYASGREREERNIFSYRKAA
jgi:hypothetical protein